MVYLYGLSLQWVLGFLRAVVKSCWKTWNLRWLDFNDVSNRFKAIESGLKCHKLCMLPVILGKPTTQPILMYTN